MALLPHFTILLNISSELCGNAYFSLSAFSVNSLSGGRYCDHVERLLGES